MRMPFTGTVPLRSGLGRAGVAGKRSQEFCAGAGETPVRAISRRTRRRTLRIEIDSFDIGLEHAVMAAPQAQATIKTSKRMV
jgi:hypothetical protein